MDISLKSSLNSIGSIMSIDLDSLEISLRSEDFQVDGGGTAARSSEDVMNHLSPLFEDSPMPDAATTSTTAMKAMQPLVETNGKLQPTTSLNMSFRITSGDLLKNQEWETESNCSVNNRLSLFLDSWSSLFKDAARDAAQASGNYKRQEQQLAAATSASSISSSEWVKDFQGETVDSGPLFPSLLMSNTSILSLSAHISPSPPDSPQRCSPNQPFHAPPLLNLVASLPVASSAVPAAKEDDSVMALAPERKRKKRKPRLLDETRVAEPTDGDVLFGRGPSINKHPGNVRFRKQAEKYHSWYMASSRKEKEEIADLLVESVQPHRFLERGKDGLWHEVIYGKHYKASQTFRDISKPKQHCPDPFPSLLS